MKPISRIAVIVALGSGLLLSRGLLAQASRTLEVQLKAAQHKEEVEGDLKGAIEQYKKLAQGGDRAVAAKALVRMAECYEKLGDSESRKLYERVVREFPDQAESATTARTRLATLREPSTRPMTMTTRRAWSPDPGSASEIFRTDGRYLPYRGSTGGLALHDLATGEDRDFTSQGPFDPSFHTAIEHAVISRDGRQVAYAFWNGNGPYDLRVVPVSAATGGAPPRVLLNHEDLSSKDLREAYPLDWSPDGKDILAFLQRKDDTYQLALISATNGALRVLKSLDWRRPNGFFSPDGRDIAYDIQLKQDSADRDIFVLAADGSREAALVEYPAVDEVLGWAPDGKRVLFTSDRTGSTGAWFVGVAEGRPQGAPELLKADIGNISPLGSTRSGALYYKVSGGAQDIYIATLDRATGNVTVPPSPVNPSRLGGKADAAWSPDGQYLAYLSGGLRIRSMRTNLERVLSLSPHLDFPRRYWGRIRWSPDGRSLLAFAANDAQRHGIYQIDTQTGATASIVPQEQGQGQPTYGVWSTDGKAIFYALNRSAFFAVTRSQLAAEGGAWFFDRTAEDKIGIRVRDLETGRDTAVYRPTLLSQINHLALSPDGRWLAFVSSRTVEIAGKPAQVEEDLLVMPATGGDPRELLQVHERVTSYSNALAVLEWTRDGEHVLYSRNRELWRVSAKGGEAQKLGLASTAARQTSLSVHPDGQRIAYTAGGPKEEVWVMENFWPAANAVR